MLADDDDFCGLLHQGFRDGWPGLRRTGVSREAGGDKKHQAAFDPNSGTASLSTARMVERSSLVIASSSADSHLRKVGIGGSFVGGMVGRLLHVPESLSFVLSVACAAGLIWFFTRRKKPAA